MRKTVPLLASLIACFALGCQDNKIKWPSASKPAASKPAEALPLYRQGTVAEYATLEGPLNMQVSGYGLVVGLGTKGSSEVPTNVESYLKEYLLKKGVGSWREGTQMVSPERVLRDKDTAVVIISGTLPPMAPVGTPFDVFVTAVPGTQTSSLEGGYLMPIELYRAAGNLIPTGNTKSMATVSGNIFVNPFLDHSKTRDLPRLREGRILNGAKITQSAVLRLVLRQADFQRCSYIQRRLNERFRTDSDKVATGTAVGVIQLNIPKQYKEDYVHFLELVMHLPLSNSAAANERLAREIARAIEEPGANARELAFVWEAMGTSVVPLLKSSYTSSVPAAAYYAAQTGLRLGDEVAIEVVIQHALNPNSPLRMTAIEELGRQHKYIRGTEPLQKLLNDPAESVRVAAYEALLHREDCTAIQRINVNDNFSLDLVQSTGNSVIYATQSGEPHIVLFGQGLILRDDVFYASADDAVTVNSTPDKPKAVVYRKIPRTGKLTQPFEVDRNVKDLVLALASSSEFGDDGKIKGLNLSYGETVSILYHLCKQGSIPAKFILQQLPEIRQIYAGQPSVGRPDTAEKSSRPDADDKPAAKDKPARSDADKFAPVDTESKAAEEGAK